MRTQLRLRRYHEFIADRNVVEQLRVITVANANVIATLLNRRVLLDLLYLSLAIAPEPIRHFDVRADLHLTGSSGAHMHRPRSRAQVNIGRTSHRQGTLK